jgi:hypothetical protein
MDSTDLAGKDNSGQLLQNCYLNDMRVLDINRMLWSRLRTHGEPPPGRYAHTFVLSEDDAILFGGWSGTNKDASPAVAFSLRDKVKGEAAPPKEEDQSCDYCMTLRTADMQWIRNKFVGIPASRRYGHSATAIGPHLIIIGGWDGGKPLNDVIVLRDRSVAEKAEQAEANLVGGDYGDLGADYGDYLDGQGDDLGDNDDWTLETG